MKPDWQLPPELLALVEEHVRDLESGDPRPDQPERSDSRLVVFCEAFFSGLYRSLGINVSRIHPTAKRRSVSARRASNALPPEITALMRSFEELCDLYPEVLGYQYGGTFGDFRLFHERFFPRLLRRLHKWLRATGQHEAADRTADVSEDYERLVAT